MIVAIIKHEKVENPLCLNIDINPEKSVKISTQTLAGLISDICRKKGFIVEIQQSNSIGQSTFTTLSVLIRYLENIKVVEDNFISPIILSIPNKLIEEENITIRPEHELLTLSFKYNKNRINPNVVANSVVGHLLNNLETKYYTLSKQINPRKITIYCDLAHPKYKWIVQEKSSKNVEIYYSLCEYRII